MVFWCQGSNGVKSGASCILSVRVLMGGMLGGILLGDGQGYVAYLVMVYWATGQG